MMTHYLDVKLHIVHYFMSSLSVYFHINSACKIKENSTCSIKPSQCVNTWKLWDCDNTNHLFLLRVIIPFYEYKSIVRKTDIFAILRINQINGLHIPSLLMDHCVPRNLDPVSSHWEVKWDPDRTSVSQVCLSRAGPWLWWIAEGWSHTLKILKWTRRWAASWVRK